jgi:AcrR family transcriptional regulator
MKTRDRIIDSAIAVCTKLGAHAMTTNHVIDHSDISPGTFYYHFKNKEELFREIFARIHGEFSSIWENSSLENIDNLLERFRMLFELYHRYVFFYQDLSMLIARDPVLARSYREVYKKNSTMIPELIGTFYKKGLLVEDVTEKHFPLMAENIWLVTEYHLPFLSARGERITKKIIHQGMNNLIMVIAPWFKEEYRKEFLTYLDK